MRSQRIQLLTFVAIVLGVIFRFTGLGTTMFSHDEAYTSLRAAGYAGSEWIDTIWVGQIVSRDDIQHYLKPLGDKDVYDTVEVVATSEPQLTPLYFIFAHYWIRHIGASNAAIRGLSAVLSLMAIPGMYWFCLELFRSRTIASVSTVLIALSPFSILLAQDARPYSLWASLTILSSAAFLAAIRKNRFIDWAIYSFSIVIGIYSHLIFMLAAAVHGLYLVAVRPYALSKRFSRYLVALIPPLLLFIPWLYQIVAHWSALQFRTGWSGNSWPVIKFIQYWLIIFAAPFIDLSLGPGNLIPYLLRALVLLLIGYGLFYLVVSTPKRIWVFLLLMISITPLLFLLSDLFRGGILSLARRYYVITNVMIIPVISNLLVNKVTLANVRYRSLWLLIAVLVLIAQIGSVINILQANTWWNKDTTWIVPEIADALNDENKPLLMVYDPSPTDFGDVLALSTMVDKNVSFGLFRKGDAVELPPDFSNIYWLHQSYLQLMDPDTGQPYQGTEVVPFYLWRVDNYPAK